MHSGSRSSLHVHVHEETRELNLPLPCFDWQQPRHILIHNQECNDLTWPTDFFSKPKNPHAMIHGAPGKSPKMHWFISATGCFVDFFPDLWLIAQRIIMMISRSLGPFKNTLGYLKNGGHYWQLLIVPRGEVRFWWSALDLMENLYPTRMLFCAQLTLNQAYSKW